MIFRYPTTKTLKKAKPTINIQQQISSSVLYIYYVILTLKYKDSDKIIRILIRKDQEEDQRQVYDPQIQEARPLL